MAPIMLETSAGTLWRVERVVKNTASCCCSHHGMDECNGQEAQAIYISNRSRGGKCTCNTIASVTASVARIIDPSSDVMEEL